MIGATVSPAQLLDHLALRLRALERSVIGLAGAPGSGKSTLAASLASRLGEECVVVPTDTVDAAGVVAALRRVRAGTETVYLPRADRGAEHAVAGRIAVRTGHRLVLVEGSHLLADEPGWSEVSSLLDETWFVEPGAAAWATRAHQADAELAGRQRAAADGIVTID